MFLTVIIHSAMFVEGSQVEAFPEAVAVPYLNSNNNQQQQSIKMLNQLFLQSLFFTDLEELVATRFPDNGPQASDGRESAQ